MAAAMQPPRSTHATAPNTIVLPVEGSIKSAEFLIAEENEFVRQALNSDAFLERMFRSLRKLNHEEIIAWYRGEKQFDNSQVQEGLAALRTRLANAGERESATSQTLLCFEIAGDGTSAGVGGRFLATPLGQFFVAYEAFRKRSSAAASWETGGVRLSDVHPPSENTSSRDLQYLARFLSRLLKKKVCRTSGSATLRPKVETVEFFSSCARSEGNRQRGRQSHRVEPRSHSGFRQQSRSARTEERIATKRTC